MEARTWQGTLPPPAGDATPAATSASRPLYRRSTGRSWHGVWQRGSGTRPRWPDCLGAPHQRLVDPALRRVSARQSVLSTYHDHRPPTRGREGPLSQGRGLAGVRCHRQGVGVFRNAAAFSQWSELYFHTAKDLDYVFGMLTSWQRTHLISDRAFMRTMPRHPARGSLPGCRRFRAERFCDF